MATLWVCEGAADPGVARALPDGLRAWTLVLQSSLGPTGFDRDPLGEPCLGALGQALVLVSPESGTSQVLTEGRRVAAVRAATRPRALVLADPLPLLEQTLHEVRTWARAKAHAALAGRLGRERPAPDEPALAGFGSPAGPTRASLTAAGELAGAVLSVRFGGAWGLCVCVLSARDWLVHGAPGLTALGVELRRVPTPDHLPSW